MGDVYPWGGIITTSTKYACSVHRGSVGWSVISQFSCASTLICGSRCTNTGPGTRCWHAVGILHNLFHSVIRIRIRTTTTRFHLHLHPGHAMRQFLCKLLLGSIPITFTRSTSERPAGFRAPLSLASPSETMWANLASLAGPAASISGDTSDVGRGVGQMRTSFDFRPICVRVCMWMSWTPPPHAVDN